MEDSNTFFDFLQNYFHQTSESQRIGMCFVERERPLRYTIKNKLFRILQRNEFWHSPKPFLFLCPGVPPLLNHRRFT